MEKQKYQRSPVRQCSLQPCWSFCFATTQVLELSKAPCSSGCMAQISPSILLHHRWLHYSRSELLSSSSGVGLFCRVVSDRFAMHACEFQYVIQRSLYIPLTLYCRGGYRGRAMGAVAPPPPLAGQTGLS